MGGFGSESEIGEELSDVSIGKGVIVVIVGVENGRVDVVERRVWIREEFGWWER